MLSVELWKWGIWTVATLGVVGTIALFAVYPIIMQTVFKVIFSVLGWLLKTRIGCAVLAAIIAGLAVDYVRHSIDDRNFAARTAAFEAAQVERDARIQRETRDIVTKEIIDQAAANTTTDTDVKEFHDALPPIPNIDAEATHLFRVGAAACRLRHIAGETECGSPGPQGMPKIRLPRSRPANH